MHFTDVNSQGNHIFILHILPYPLPLSHFIPFCYFYDADYFCSSKTQEKLPPTILHSFYHGWPDIVCFINKISNKDFQKEMAINKFATKIIF